MSLTEYFVDIGRPIAFYPSLKKVALTTTASILLCQLLYWTNKTKDGWIWKTAEQLEEETGLSYEEQKTARAKLREIRIITEDYDRVNHELKFKIDEDELNKRWAECGGKTIKPINSTAPLPIAVEEIPPTPEVEEKNSYKKGDLVDLMRDVNQNPEEWPGIKKEGFRNAVKSKFATRLHVNPDTGRWKTFIEYAMNRDLNHNEPVDKFIDWLILQGFFENSSYWPPNKMLELWPQAFMKIEKQVINIDNFVAKLPETKEEKYVPMPTGLFKKKLE